MPSSNGAGSARPRHFPRDHDADAEDGCGERPPLRAAARRARGGESAGAARTRRTIGESMNHDLKARGTARFGSANSRIFSEPVRGPERYLRGVVGIARPKALRCRAPRRRPRRRVGRAWAESTSKRSTRSTRGTSRASFIGSWATTASSMTSCRKRSSTPSTGSQRLQRSVRGPRMARHRRGPSHASGARAPAPSHDVRVLDRRTSRRAPPTRAIARPSTSSTTRSRACPRICASRGCSIAWSISACRRRRRHARCRSRR